VAASLRVVGAFYGDRQNADAALCKAEWAFDQLKQARHSLKHDTPGAANDLALHVAEVEKWLHNARRFLEQRGEA
jgi:hypothetical protein